jgi:DNA-directed RNA polymerase subunit H (RpoH/RPB5)
MPRVTPTLFYEDTVQDDDRADIVRGTLRRLLSSRGLQITKEHATEDTPRYHLWMEGDMHVYGCAVTAKLGIEQFRRIIDHDPHPRLLFVSRDAPSSRSIAYCEEVGVELWSFDQLIFPIIDHIYQPRFMVLDQEEQKKVEQMYRGMVLPRMASQDPVARWYGMKKGQVVRIERGLPSGATMVVHRVVV